MLTLVSLIHVVISLFLILVVLLQQGKGADLSVFGGGGSQAAFGARSATTILHKLTVIGFVAFIFTTITIGLLQSGGGGGSVIGDDVAVESTVLDEATDAEAAAADLEETVDEAAASVEESAADFVDEATGDSDVEPVADGDNNQ